MSEQTNLNNLGYIAIPKLSTMQNVQVRAINFPDWMDPLLVSALRSLFDQRVVLIDSLVSGLTFNSFGSSYTLTPACRPAFYWEELDGYPIQKTLDHWMRAIAKVYGDTDASDGDTENLRLGPDLMIFEPNRTFTEAARTWSIKNATPRSSGEIHATRQIEPQVVSGASLRVDMREDTIYDAADDIEWVNEFLAMQSGNPVDPAVAKYDQKEMLKSLSRITYHFSLDKDDPKPAETLSFVQEEARRQNIDLVIDGDSVDTTDGVRDEVLKALDERSAVIHLAVNKDEGDPVQTVKDLIKHFGDAGVHLAIHVDPANIPADAWGASAVLTASTVLHKQTPSIKAFTGTEQEAVDKEWFEIAKANMTDEQWDAFAKYDETLVAPFGYTGKKIQIERNGAVLSYVGDYYQLMRKWFEENIMEKGIPGNEAPEGWKS